MKKIDIICNTSPIIGLISIDRLYLLWDLFGSIIIPEAVFNELEIPMEQCLDSVRRYGNTSASSIPLAWYNGIREDKIQLNDTLMLMGFGGGFTYGGLCIQNNICKVDNM